MNNIVEGIFLLCDMSVVNNHSGGSCNNTDLITDETGLPPIESPSCSGVEEKASTSFNIEGQHEEKNITENISSSNDVSIVESYPSSSNVELSPNFFQYHYTSPKASPNLTLEEKVSNFVQNGDLGKINDGFLISFALSIVVVSLMEQILVLNGA